MRLASLQFSGDEVLAVIAGDHWLAAADLLPDGPHTMADLSGSRRVTAGVIA